MRPSNANVRPTFPKQLYKIFHPGLSKQGGARDVTGWHPASIKSEGQFIFWDVKHSGVRTGDARRAPSIFGETANRPHLLFKPPPPRDRTIIAGRLFVPADPGGGEIKTGGARSLQVFGSQPGERVFDYFHIFISGAKRRDICSFGDLTRFSSMETQREHLC